LTISVAKNLGRGGGGIVVIDASDVLEGGFYLFEGLGFVSTLIKYAKAQMSAQDRDSPTTSTCVDEYDLCLYFCTICWSTSMWICRQ